VLESTSKSRPSRANFPGDRMFFGNHVATAVSHTGLGARVRKHYSSRPGAGRLPRSRYEILPGPFVCLRGARLARLARFVAPLCRAPRSITGPRLSPPDGSSDTSRPSHRDDAAINRTFSSGAATRKDPGFRPGSLQLTWMSTFAHNSMIELSARVNAVAGSCPEYLKRCERL